MSVRNCVQAKPVRKFTSSELRELDKPHNAHIAVRGKVYDVSKFVARHPGGMEQIMMGVGRDVTAVFESYHSFDVYKVLEQFYVGDLVDNEFPVFPETGEFYPTLKRRVAAFFKDNNIDPKIDYWMFLRYAMVFLLSHVGWIATVYFHDNLFLCLPFAVISGVLFALILFTCGHDASHFAITHKPWVWNTVGFAHSFFYGASRYNWIYQHVFGHHPYPNIDGADPDIGTAASDVPDFHRIKWTQKWVPHYLYQHVYAPMLYCLMSAKIRLDDLVILYNLQNDSVRMNRPNWNQLLIFFAEKVTYIIYRIIIPSLFMPWTRVVLLNIITDVVFGYILGFITQCTHVVSEVEWPVPDKDNKIHMDWAEMQVATAQDYATRSWFWTMFTGALNHQTTHHLFPGVIQSHYPKITPIVEQTCKEFGIKYHYIDTATEAIGCHINHLKKLGQGNKEL